MIERSLIRTARPSDLSDIQEICLKTADNGQDGSELYRHPQLLWSFYVDPYIEHETDRCFMVEDDQGPSGYILGALDTNRLLIWAAENMIPAIRVQYPLNPSGIERFPADQALVDQLHRDQWLPGFLNDFPSQLHINLLPRAQGKGYGRILIETLLYRLTQLGSCGLFLGVGELNVRAQGFYRHLGFEELGSDPGVVWMGLKLKR